MKKLFVLIPIVLMLAACGEESKIKEVVRSNLKDPESAQFKDAVVSADGKRACIVWNAKNSMGGYGDWKAASLNMGDGLTKETAWGWHIEELAASPESCSETVFQEYDVEVTAKAAEAAIDAKFYDRFGKVIDKVGDDAELQAIEILMKSKNISNEEAKKLADWDGKCGSLVLNYVVSSKVAAELPIRAREDSNVKFTSEEVEKELVRMAADLKIQKTKLEKGDCEDSYVYVSPRQEEINKDMKNILAESEMALAKFKKDVPKEGANVAPAPPKVSVP